MDGWGSRTLRNYDRKLAIFKPEEEDKPFFVLVRILPIFLSPAHEHQGIRDLKPKEPKLEVGRFS